MLYILRQYCIAPGKQAEFEERFQSHAIRLFEKFGFSIVCYGWKQAGDGEWDFNYVLSIADQADYQQAWQAFIDDTERTQIWVESDKNGKLVTKISNQPFSS